MAFLRASTSLASTALSFFNEPTLKIRNRKRTRNQEKAECKLLKAILQGVLNIGIRYIVNFVITFGEYKTGWLWVRGGTTYPLPIHLACVPGVQNLSPYTIKTPLVWILDFVYRDC